jgi:hypothetical protein
MGSICIHDVPDDVLRTLGARAAAAGTTVENYVLVELTRWVRSPTAPELDRRLGDRGEATVGTAAILAARDAGRRT